MTLSSGFASFPSESTSSDSSLSLRESRSTCGEEQYPFTDHKVLLERGECFTGGGGGGGGGGGSTYQ